MIVSTHMCSQQDNFMWPTSSLPEKLSSYQLDSLRATGQTSHGVTCWAQSVWCGGEEKQENHHPCLTTVLSWAGRQAVTSSMRQTSELCAIQSLCPNPTWGLNFFLHPARRKATYSEGKRCFTFKSN